LSDNTATGMLH